jgi:hypothetical protein
MVKRIVRIAKFIFCAPLMFALGVTQGDFIRASLGATETTESSLGTINIPAGGVTRIVGIYGICSIQTPTSGQGGSADFRLAFKTVPGSFKFPAAVLYGPLTAGSPAMGLPYIIPVNIPVPPLETVNAFMTQEIAQTGSCVGTVGLLLE